MCSKCDEEKDGEQGEVHCVLRSLVEEWKLRQVSSCLELGSVYCREKSLQVFGSFLSLIKVNVEDTRVWESSGCIDIGSISESV